MRELGQEIKISISTALAVEALYGIGEFEGKEPVVQKESHFLINLSTLFRNAQGSVHREYRDKMTPEFVSQIMFEDVEGLRTYLPHESIRRGQLLFYYCQRRRWEDFFPKAKHRLPFTKLQKDYAKLEQRTLNHFFLTIKNQYHEHHHILRYPRLLAYSNSTRMLLLSHQPMDLLSAIQFKDLVLWESHTGELKPCTLWSTKLTGGAQLDNIPFNRLTLQLFGDGVHFKSFNPTDKRPLLELADKKRWTSATSIDKVKVDIKTLDNPYRSLYLDLLG